jgi:hypothetical protein
VFSNSKSNELWWQVNFQFPLDNRMKDENCWGRLATRNDWLAMTLSKTSLQSNEPVSYQQPIKSNLCIKMKSYHVWKCTESQKLRVRKSKKKCCCLMYPHRHYIFETHIEATTNKRKSNLCIITKSYHIQKVRNKEFESQKKSVDLYIYILIDIYLKSLI